MSLHVLIVFFGRIHPSIYRVGVRAFGPSACVHIILTNATRLLWRAAHSLSKWMRIAYFWHAFKCQLLWFYFIIMNLTCDNTTTETMPHAIQYTKTHLHIPSVHVDTYNKWQSKFMPDANFNGHPTWKCDTENRNLFRGIRLRKQRIWSYLFVVSSPITITNLSLSIHRIHSDIYFSIIIYDNLRFRSGASYALRFLCSDAVDNKWQWMLCTRDWIVYIFSLLNTHWTGNTFATKCKCQSTIRAHSIQMTCINRTPEHFLFIYFY